MHAVVSVCITCSVRVYVYVKGDHVCVVILYTQTLTPVLVQQWQGQTLAKGWESVSTSAGI